MTTPNRLLFLDVMRGAAILLIILLHALGGVVMGYDRAAVNDVSIWAFIAVAPLAILATWAPLFALISGTANAYVMHHRLSQCAPGAERDKLRWALLIKGLKVSLLLYVLSLVNMAFMHHGMEFNGFRQYTLLTGALEMGHWLPLHVDLLFFNDALGLIAVSVAATTLALFFMWRGNGLENPRRVLTISAGIAALWFVASPGLHAWLDGAFYGALNNQQYFKALLLKTLLGPGQSPAPNVAFAFVGIVFGLCLARGTAAAAFRRWGYASGSMLLLIAAAMLAMQGFAPPDLAAQPFPMKLHFLNLGLMICVCTWLIDTMELGSRERRDRAARRTVFLRRVGMVALSVFLLESLVATIIGRMFGGFLGEAWSSNPLLAGIYLASLLAFWLTCLRVWERADFRYSFEWLTIRLTQSRASPATQRLNAQRILYNPDNT